VGFPKNTKHSLSLVFSLEAVIIFEFRNKYRLGILNDITMGFALFPVDVIREIK
jgi:hypothetical protein